MTQGSDLILDRMMALHPKIIDLTLDRVWTLLAALDDPQTKLPPVIHIAGTNGKGSTQAMFRAGIEGAGKTAHAYTSPHLARFHERIRLAGDLISEPHLTEVLNDCYAANDGANITYFEITTVAALLAFARTPADYTLLEVGLGGRLDATNVIETPALTVITPVSMDHEGFLGDTLAKIAGEKAGIIKRGVPCVVGPQQDDALEVIEAKAASLGAPLLAYGQHWHVWEERGRLVFQDEHGLMDLPLPALIGKHQIENAGIVIAGLRHLDRQGQGQGKGFGETAIEAAVTDAVWPARMQRLKTGPLVDMASPSDLWLDGGHNPAAGAALAEALTRLPPKPLHLICGMLNTKDASGYMAPLKGAKHLHAVTIPNETATLSAEETMAAATRAGLTASAAPDVETAIQTITATDPNARILICGSLYLAGHILKENG